MKPNKPTVTKPAPCNNCPWRKDAPLEYWHPDHFHEIAETCRGDGMHVMLCHKSNDTNAPTNFYCAGWIASQKFESIGVRLIAIQGKLDYDHDYSGGHELYTFDEMLEANNIKVSGPYDHNIERLRAMMENEND